MKSILKEIQSQSILITQRKSLKSKRIINVSFIAIQYVDRKDKEGNVIEEEGEEGEFEDDEDEEDYEEDDEEDFSEDEDFEEES